MVAEKLKSRSKVGAARLDEARRALAADPEHLKYAAALACTAHHRHHRAIDREELEAAARLGLCLAARTYRKGGRAKFTTFCTTHVRGTIVEAAGWEAARGFGLPAVERRRVTPLPWPGTLDGPDLLPERATDVGRLAVVERVRSAIATLPDRHRKAIAALYGVDGLKRVTHAAFAHNRGWPISRVREIEAEALTMLRERLAADVTTPEED